jgi:hypothetical protein
MQIFGHAEPAECERRRALESAGVTQGPTVIPWSAQARAHTEVNRARARAVVLRVWRPRKLWITSHESMQTGARDRASSVGGRSDVQEFRNGLSRSGRSTARIASARA